MHELFDAATMAEMRAINNANLPHTALVLALVEEAGAGASVRPGVWTPLADVDPIPCRLSPYRPKEDLERTRPAHRGSYVVIVSTESTVDPKNRLRISGSTNLIPWTVDLDIDGVEAPGSFEILRRIHCTDVGYNPRITSSDPGSLETVVVGATKQFTVEVADHAGALISGVPVLWATDDSGIATIDDTGLLTGMSVGTVRVRATVGLTFDHRTISVIAP
jgi:hypothetical protein